MSSSQVLSIRRHPGRLAAEYGILISLVIITVALALSNRYFLTEGNIVNVLRQVSVNGILATGMTFVILTGGIDLSIGSVLAVSAMVAGSFAVGDHPMNPALAMLIGVAVGAAFGAINGTFIAFLGLPAFVMTLGIRSARTSGINTRGMIFSVYVVMGALAALAGIILTARVSSALPQAGLSYELDAIAAVVIGGTSLTGGVGSITYTLIGVLIIGVINNGLDLLSVSSYYQQVVKGLIIVIAVLIDRSRNLTT